MMHNAKWMPKRNACKYSLTCGVLILRLAYKILAFVYVFMEICFLVK